MILREKLSIDRDPRADYNLLYRLEDERFSGVLMASMLKHLARCTIMYLPTCNACSLLVETADKFNLRREDLADLALMIRH